MLSYSPDETYTFDDLQHWAYPGPSLAVVGFPVRHSISPAMHNAALRTMSSAHPGLAQWKYFRFEVPPEQLPQALPYFRKAGFFGLNLTVPHKEIAVPEIQSIDPSAQRISAVNTLRRLENGYEGFNTDGYGLEMGIKTELGQNITGNHIALIGAGGAGRAAAIQCIESACASLTIINRNQERLQKLENDIAPFAQEKGVPIRAYSSSDPIETEANTIFVNATSLGLKSGDPLPIDPKIFQPNDFLYDMIYNPAVTPLMAAATSSGCKTANGLAMLIFQGVKALEIWTQQKVPDSAMSAAAKNALA